MAKPTLVYDGECSFCIVWVGRLKHVTKDSVEYLASNEVFERFPQISIEDYARSIQCIDTEGNVLEGAEALFTALSFVPGKKWLLWIYQNIPGFGIGFSSCPVGC